MGTPQTLGARGGSWILSELKPLINCESKIIDNSAGTTALLVPAGYPMKGANPLISTDTIATDLTGLLVQRALVGPGEKLKVAVVQRGPLAIDFDALPTNYIQYPPGTGATGAINAANFKTGIALMSPAPVLRYEPVKVTEQTT